MNQVTQQEPSNETRNSPNMANNTSNIIQVNTTGDITQVNVEKFDGISGLSVDDFLRNIEANGTSKGLTGEALDKHCVALARNRIDLT